MKWLVQIIVVGLWCVFLSACNSSDSIGEKIEQMKSQPVNVDFGKMSCWMNDSAVDVRPWEEKSKLKLIVYVDSALCTSCYIKRMYSWYECLDDTKKYDDFYVYFVFGMKKGEESKYKALNFKLSTLDHPMYIDETNSLIAGNPQIPKEPLFHTFLLDENNNLILVGSPLQTKKMKELLYKTIEEKSEAKLPSSITN